MYRIYSLRFNEHRRPIIHTSSSYTPTASHDISFQVITRRITWFSYHSNTLTPVVTPLERLVRLSSYIEEIHQNQQALILLDLYCILLYCIIIIYIFYFIVFFFFRFHFLGYTAFPFLLVLHIPWLSHIISDKYKDFVIKIFIQINLKTASVGQPKYCILTKLCSAFHF